MSTRSLNLNDELYSYYQQHAFRDQEILAELRTETAKLSESVMQISPEQGAFMSMLVKLTGAKRILEIGTFTGYSSLSMALALPKDAQMICLDVSEEWTSTAQKYWQKAGVVQKIDLRIAPALESLKSLQSEGQKFDLVFIDADKESYLKYYEEVLKLTDTGAAILFDNVLWGGSVIDKTKQSESTQAIRELNETLLKDQRVELCMLPIGDGLTILRKK